MDTDFESILTIGYWADWPIHPPGQRTCPAPHCRYYYGGRLLARCALSARRDVDHFSAVEHAPRLVAIEIVFPCRDDDGRHAVADQVAERAGHADEPVDR